LAVTVSTWVLPSAVTEALVGLSVECVALTAPDVPIAVMLTGDPVNDPLVAVNVFTPAVVPRVQAGLVAMPLLSVVTALEEDNDPPPPPTANVTDTPLTPFPCASLTLTAGAVATAVPTVALWPVPAEAAICVAAPALTVTFCESAAVSVGLEVNRRT
jgi:hypothetical protein